MIFRLTKIDLLTEPSNACTFPFGCRIAGNAVVPSQADSAKEIGPLIKKMTTHRIRWNESTFLWYAFAKRTSCAPLSERPVNSIQLNHLTPTLRSPPRNLSFSLSLYPIIRPITMQKHHLNNHVIFSFTLKRPSWLWVKSDELPECEGTIIYMFLTAVVNLFFFVCSLPNLCPMFVKDIFDWFYSRTVEKAISIPKSVKYFRYRELRVCFDRFVGKQFS